jgi:hypothetical protein
VELVQYIIITHGQTALGRFILRMRSPKVRVSSKLPRFGGAFFCAPSVLSRRELANAKRGIESAPEHVQLTLIRHGRACPGHLDHRGTA